MYELARKVAQVYYVNGCAADPYVEGTRTTTDHPARRHVREAKRLGELKLGDQDSPDSPESPDKDELTVGQINKIIQERLTGETA